MVSGSHQALFFHIFREIETDLRPFAQRTLGKNIFPLAQATHTTSPSPTGCPQGRKEPGTHTNNQRHGSARCSCRPSGTEY